MKAIRCDLVKEEEILAMFAAIKTEFGGVDVCVNNAGLAHDAPLLSGETWQFRNTLEVGTFLSVEIWLYNVHVLCMS